MTNEPQVSPTPSKTQKNNPWIIVDKILRRVEVLVVAFRVLVFFYFISTTVIVLVLSGGAFDIGFPAFLGLSLLSLVLILSTLQPPTLRKFHENVKKLLKPKTKSNNQVQTESSQSDTIDSLFTFAIVESVMSDSVAIDIGGGDCDGGDCGDGGDSGGGDCGGCD